jgi:hypothetical protein
MRPDRWLQYVFTAGAGGAMGLLIAFLAYGGGSPTSEIQVVSGATTSTTAGLVPTLAPPETSITEPATTSITVQPTTTTTAKPTTTSTTAATTTTRLPTTTTAKGDDYGKGSHHHDDPANVDHLVVHADLVDLSRQLRVTGERPAKLRVYRRNVHRLVAGVTGVVLFGLSAFSSDPVAMLLRGTGVVFLVMAAFGRPEPTCSPFQEVAHFLLWAGLAVGVVVLGTYIIE